MNGVSNMNAGKNGRKPAVYRGTILTIGMIIAHFVSALGAITIARILGPKNYGIVAIVAAIPIALAPISSFGTVPATTRFLAYYEGRRNLKKMKTTMITATIFIGSAGLLLSCLCYLAADTISTILLGDAGFKELVQAASFFIIANRVFVISRSALLGLGKHETLSVMFVSVEIMRTILSVLLVLTGFGYFGPILGQNIAVLLIGLFFLIPSYTRILAIGTQTKKADLTSSLKEMLHYGLPLTIGTITATLQPQLNIILLGMFVTLLDIGYYTMADKTLRVFTSMLYSSMSLILFPEFSRISNPKQRKICFARSEKYAGLITAPIVVGVMALATPLIQLFFGSTFLGSIWILQLLGFKYICLGLLYTYRGFLQGVGETQQLTLMDVAQLLGTGGILIALAPKIGIFALVVSDISLSIGWLAFANWYTHKKYGTKRLPSLRVYACSATMGIVMIAMQTIVTEEHLVVQLLTSTIIGAMSLITLLPITGAVEPSDITDLRKAFEETQILRAFIDPVFLFMERILYLKKNDKIAEEKTLVRQL